ncbi:hypothetical protein NDI56_01165 [Haloarcula sp. S1CR25-12]|uniref:Uncharacterized protein n=1 Tax=Haloarcula saliterrae TaxID=2950534 RepID=A0ABU2F6W9_9EURY|nr:hypothetical protein [Haloarcula sp. S1CR25-12]MDS0258012.1 hypothetical protein [Haloarcula sp. S1CR25-12]
MTTIATRQHGDPPETLAELLDDLEQRPSLSVEADLTLQLDGHTATVVGYDDLVAIDLPSLPAAVSLWRNRPVAVMDAAAVLSSVGLTVELRVRGAPVARIGDAAAPSGVARRLGLGPVELVPEGAVLALTRRRG